ncbi:hypothetical protein CFK37_06365 [Virgibacillus phasianinus]|uniref:Uncharacterized protein n=1 Tax=Virgibacillus phasianinus TaxID=2017483 RepID=A0A220U1K0_9BACI|nr:hypothetical protein [Virgibacillus phasianinus]ASK61806.1 hypothetical protein CFK37_06365 [Virgibacillus phasianinus]
MTPLILTLVFLIIFVISIFINVKKRRAAGITGLKSGLSSICLYAVALINVVGYWFDVLGIASWLLTFGLILAAAYFTKYLPQYHDKTES